MANPKLELSREPGVAQTGVSTKRMIAGVILLALLLAVGVLPKLNRNQRASSIAKAAEGDLPVVNVVRAESAPPTTDLVLPGNTEALTQARIFARASGYVRSRSVDIGTLVKSGQVLAVIESPEVDQELAQARANLEQARANVEQQRANLEQTHAAALQAQSNVEVAKANEEIAQTTHQRWDRLVTKGVLARQSGDERRTTFLARKAETAAAEAAFRTAQANVSSQQANVRAAEAAVNAQSANVRRLERLQAFEYVRAPFDGVITERNVEQGDLIQPASGEVRNLFSIAQAKTLRIQVDVPQSYAVELQPGQPAEITVRERPGRKFAGTVARTANALNNNSRTLRVEVQVDNKAGELLPGMYSQVRFSLSRSRPTVLIRADALVANSGGTRVARVTNGKVQFVQVLLGRDLGTQLEVLSGLNGGDVVISSPPDTLVDGQQVQVAKGDNKKS
ncbi:MAG TPA: efflux RND transporter periplasmic adaptor subunit [Bryobacteraceae bacterium]|jgi:RND family efflux transporter MFP subunit|nr:efflux RND transporter periplasmic adaptor subunit [Bryobacteraceae bacterium]